MVLQMKNFGHHKILVLSQDTLISFEKQNVITFLDSLEQPVMRDRREQGHEGIYRWKVEFYNEYDNLWAVNEVI